MRDPNRINEFCNHFAELWKTNCPDWRFGQLISNIISVDGELSWFYREDDKMIEHIDNFFKEMFKVDEEDG